MSIYTYLINDSTVNFLHNRVKTEDPIIIATCSENRNTSKSSKTLQLRTYLDKNTQRETQKMPNHLGLWVLVFPTSQSVIWS